MSHNHETLSSERELAFYEEHHELSNSALHLDTDVSVGAGGLTPFTASGSADCSPATELKGLESASANVNSASYKRMMRLVRNREAARRNRIKKKDWINQLQETNKTAKETNLKLKKKLAALELEYQQLQSLIIPSVNETPMISMVDIAPSADFRV